MKFWKISYQYEYASLQSKQYAYACLPNVHNLIQECIYVIEKQSNGSNRARILEIYDVIT